MSDIDRLEYAGDLMDLALDLIAEGRDSDALVYARASNRRLRQLLEVKHGVREAFREAEDR